MGVVLKDKLARAKAKDTMEYLLSLDDMGPVFVFTSTNTANSFCQRVFNNAAIELKGVQAASIVLCVTSLTTPTEPLIGRSMSPVRAGNSVQKKAIPIRVQTTPTKPVIVRSMSPVRAGNKLDYLRYQSPVVKKATPVRVLSPCIKDALRRMEETSLRLLEEQNKRLLEEQKKELRQTNRLKAKAAWAAAHATKQTAEVELVE